MRILILLLASFPLPASSILTDTACGYYFGATVDSAAPGGPGVSASNCSASRIDRGQRVSGSIQAAVTESPNLAQVSVSFFDYRFAPVGLRGEATWRETFLVTFGGYTGSALFVPCLFAGAVEGTTATTQYGPYTIASLGGQSASSCTGSFHGGAIPFTFGQPQELTIALRVAGGSDTSVNPGGGMQAKFDYSFEVWRLDTSAERLTSATWTIVPVPEPSLALPTCLLLIALKVRRLAHPSAKPHRTPGRIR